MSSVVVLTSGGMDSTALLYHHFKSGHRVRAISFNYGQRHKKELILARLNADMLDVPYEEVDLSSLSRILPGSSQTDTSIDVPEGHYSEENMKATVVPNRNMILLSIAIGHAIAHDCEFVSYAAHGGDHAIYPDCRPEFAALMNQAAQMCDWKKVELHTPFIGISKAKVAELGHRLGVNFGLTWSCYKGQDLHCGRCGTCIERREAFHLAGIPDPTQYHADAPSVRRMVQFNWRLPEDTTKV